jgi:hypothetical protein
MGEAGGDDLKIAISPVIQFGNEIEEDRQIKQGNSLQ